MLIVPYVLIAYFNYGQSVALNSIRFESRETCLVARNELIKSGVHYAQCFQQEIIRKESK